MIGVDPRWHQGPPRYASHYHVTRSKRALAIAAGAVEVTEAVARAMMARCRATGILGDPADAVEWARSRKDRA
jgi:hypothetical protein